MDPDILMNSMERITLLYKVLKQTHLEESKEILTRALKHFLGESLPAAATLSRVVIEFIEFFKDGKGVEARCEVRGAQVVNEVFETSITQDQLPVLSGWIFEALAHLLNGKISHSLTPYCVLTLLVSASSNHHIRLMAPLTYYILRLGIEKSFDNETLNTNETDFMGIFKDNFYNGEVDMSFQDRRLLCIVALKSGFSRSQLERLRELCECVEGLDDLKQCLVVQ